MSAGSFEESQPHLEVEPQVDEESLGEVEPQVDDEVEIGASNIQIPHVPQEWIGQLLLVREEVSNIGIVTSSWTSSLDLTGSFMLPIKEGIVELQTQAALVLSKIDMVIEEGLTTSGSFWQLGMEFDNVMHNYNMLLTAIKDMDEASTPSQRTLARKPSDEMTVP